MKVLRRVKNEAVLSGGWDALGRRGKILSSYPWLKYISVTQGGQVALSNTPVLAVH